MLTILLSGACICWAAVIIVAAALAISMHVIANNVRKGRFK